MATGVKLNTRDLELIIDALQMICDYKILVLRSRSWTKFQNEYLTSALDQIAKNEFTVNISTNNFFTWFLDNLCWSKKIIPGLAPKDGIPLIDLPIGERVAAISRAASRGQSTYDLFAHPSCFSDLFD